MLNGNLSNSQFFAKVDKISSFALLNLLWVLFALPIVTLPAATAGMFAVFADWERGKESEALQRFWEGFRQFWRKSSLMALLNLGLLVLIALNLNILPLMDMPQPILFAARGIVLMVALLTIAANLYAWTLLVVFDLPLADLIQIALKLVFQHTAWTAGLLMGVGLVLSVGLFLPAGFAMVALISACAWLINKGAWHIIRHYETELHTLSSQNKKGIL